MSRVLGNLLRRQVSSGTGIVAASSWISDTLPFVRLWYDGPNAVTNAIGYANHRSRSHRAVIRVYDETGNVIETHEHAAISKSGDRAKQKAATW
jgi:hypothetical protein